MSRLLLLRHARAGWAGPGMRDVDRPLTEHGRTDAGAVGAAMRVCGYLPELVLSSTARRARETWECIASSAGMPAAAATFADGLYGCDAAGYLAMVRNAGANTDSVMVVGHNPMIEDLAVALSGSGEGLATAALGHGFPTSGLAVISFRCSLAQATPGGGHLEEFLTPSRL